MFYFSIYFNQKKKLNKIKRQKKIKYFIHLFIILKKIK